jgi:tRNA-dihydrouridine synthase
MIRTVKRSVTIPVIGNGDVRTAQDAKRIMDETGCDGVMIGRAIQGYPWIFREAKHYLETGRVPEPPTLEERQAVMLRHLHDMASLVGEDVGVREMRKHLCWYTKGLHDGAEFRTRINHLVRVKDTRRAIEDFFTTLNTSALVEQHVS